MFRSYPFNKKTAREKNMPILQCTNGFLQKVFHILSNEESAKLCVVAPLREKTCGVLHLQAKNN
jgi:hypothetical protein